MDIKGLPPGIDPYTQKPKVDNKSETSNAASVDTRGKNRLRQTESGQDSQDKVSFSTEAKLRTEAHAKALNTPDARREKIEAIKAQIANGEYEMNTRKIATNLLREEIELFS